MGVSTRSRILRFGFYEEDFKGTDYKGIKTVVESRNLYQQSCLVITSGPRVGGAVNRNLEEDSEKRPFREAAAFSQGLQPARAALRVKS